jgi:hypothetical protein
MEYQEFLAKLFPEGMHKDYKENSSIKHVFCKNKMFMNKLVIVKG